MPIHEVFTGALTIRLGLVALLAIAVSDCKRDTSKPAPASEPFPPQARHSGSLAQRSEPWPSTASWTDRFGQGPFALVSTGQSYTFFPAGSTLYVYNGLQLFRVVRRPEQSQSLDPLDLPAQVAGGGWRMDELWVNDACAPCVWMDRDRHYSGPSQEALVFAAQGSGWNLIAKSQEGVRSNRPDNRGIPWSGGGTLLAQDVGLRWQPESAAPLPTVPDFESRGCGSFSTYAARGARSIVDKDSTYVLVSGCASHPDSILHFGKDAVGRALPPLPHPDSSIVKLVLGIDGRLIVVARCSRVARYDNAVCVSVLDGQSWSDEGKQMDGMDIGSVEYTKDGTLWVVLAHRGDGSSGLARPRGPCPGGELHRRSAKGQWDQVLFPEHQLPNWHLVRFAPLSLALADGVPWVAGTWYYLRKPTPEVVETRILPGLFRFTGENVTP